MIFNFRKSFSESEPQKQVVVKIIVFYSRMGSQIKLKDSALAFLLEELEKGEMLAIYLMASGVEMTDKVTKSGMVIDLISICLPFCN